VIPERDNGLPGAVLPSGFPWAKRAIDGSRPETIYPEKVCWRHEQLLRLAKSGFTAERMPPGGRLGKVVGMHMGYPLQPNLQASMRSTTASGHPSAEAIHHDPRHPGLRSRKS
jgi:hypothetical protein